MARAASRGPSSSPVLFDSTIHPMATRPLIGITVDNVRNSAASGRYECSIGYSRAVTVAGGLPLLLPHEPSLAGQYVDLCDGFVLTGGVDPRTEPFGEPTHPEARPLDPRRQAFESALLQALRNRPAVPVLGVCLGMQLMALEGGGRLHQFLPEVLGIQAALVHEDGRRHGLVWSGSSPGIGPADPEPDAGPATGDTVRGTVVSRHRQSVADPGRLRVLAKAPDGVIEAIDDPRRPFYVGVQWHPERGGPGPLNHGLFERLVAACRTTSVPSTARPHTPGPRPRH